MTNKTRRCNAKMCGEYNWLRCCDEDGHTGEHNYVVDGKPHDILQAATRDAGDDTLKTLLSSAWGVDVKYNRDNSVKRIVIDVRDTAEFNPTFIARSMQLIEQFIAERAIAASTPKGDGND